MTDQQPRPDGRRKFCQVCIGGMTVTSAAMVGYPVLAFLGRPMRLSANKPIEMPVAELAPGQAKYVDLHGQQVIVLATEQGPNVLAASCPHLGCNVTWDAADSLFRCPCHGAVFNASGDVVSGPVSAPLKKIPFEIKGDKLIIS